MLIDPRTRPSRSLIGADGAEALDLFLVVDRVPLVAVGDRVRRSLWEPVAVDDLLDATLGQVREDRFARGGDVGIIALPSLRSLVVVTDGGPAFRLVEVDPPAILLRHEMRVVVRLGGQFVEFSNDHPVQQTPVPDVLPEHEEHYIWLFEE
jgi:hypothetical protein